MRWEIKGRKKWELKIRKHFRKLSQLDASHFSKHLMSNDCKSNVSVHQSCTIEVFRFEKKLQAYLVGLPEYCNTWKCLHTLLKLKKEEFKKKKKLNKHCRGGLEVTRAETIFFWPKMTGLINAILLNYCTQTR